MRTPGALPLASRPAKKFTLRIHRRCLRTAQSTAGLALRRAPNTPKRGDRKFGLILASFFFPIHFQRFCPVHQQIYKMLASSAVKARPAVTRQIQARGAIAIRTASAWSQVPQGPPDAILGITEAFKADSHPEKINLGTSAQTPGSWYFN